MYYWVGFWVLVGFFWWVREEFLGVVGVKVFAIGL